MPRILSKIEEAAFSLEVVAHLKMFERELLPLAEHLREIHSYAQRIGSGAGDDAWEASVADLTAAVLS